MALPGLQSSGISIHALREEGDDSEMRNAGRRDDFYPRPPRGGRRPCRSRLHDYQRISIHALREEGDPMRALRTEGLK